MEPDLEQLLARSTWVRKLARGMVVGADEADDLAQETWAAVLERPPARELPFKAWIAGVMRNLARQRQRGATRRLERERAVARDESCEDRALIERLELHRRLVEAVHSLENPYRRVLLLRYFEALSPAEIAARMGTPLRTVHTQLQRGLARLRERLGPHSRDQLLALAMPLPSLATVAAPAAAAVVGAVFMNLKVSLGVCAAVIVGAGALLFAPWRDAQRSADPAGIAREAKGSAVETPEPVRSATPIPESSEATRTLATQDGAVNAAPPAARDVAQAEIRARFLLPDGAPAVGASLMLHGWCGNEERGRQFGIPESWADPEGLSGADGRVSLKFDPPPAFSFVLSLRRSGSATLAWDWFEIPRGKITDLGEIKLQAAGSIRGRVVDAAGQPLAQKWRVYAVAAYQPPGQGGVRTQVVAQTDPSSAEFILDGLPPGAAQLKASSDLVNLILGPVVAVESGKQLSADIVYSGPDLGRRILVSISLPRTYPFDDLAASALRLEGPTGERIPAQRVDGMYSAWKFDDLQPGTYSLRMEDARFQAWSRGGIQPGEYVKVKLAGNAAIQLAVRDAATGAAIDDYTLRLDRREFGQLGGFSQDPAILRAADALAPPGGLYEGLVGGDTTTITVGAPGYSEKTLDLQALTAGEKRSVAVELDQGSRIAGIVTAGDLPRADVVVNLRSAVEAPDDLGGEAYSRTFNQMRNAFRAQLETRTDADGRFVFERIPPGRYEACTQDGPRLVARAGPIECPGENEALHLSLPPSGWLVASVNAPAGASYAGLGLAIESMKAQELDRFESLRMTVESSSMPEFEPLDSRGHLRVGPLPLGEYRVQLSTGMVMQASGFQSMSGAEGERVDLGTIVIAAGDNPREFDLLEQFPGRISITLFVDGKPASAVECMALREGRSKFAFTTYDAVGSCGPDGFAELGPILPGEISLFAGMIDGSWLWRSPQRVSLPAGGKLSLRLDIALHSGVLHIDDAGTGKPLANQDLLIDTGASAISAKTDDHGDVRLRLPDGSYWIKAGRERGNAESAGPKIEWGPQGPTPALLRLPAH